jgi:Sulfotransferase family
MIVSFARKFVFAAVPKTGTHAVRQALRAHLGPEDIEQVGLFVQKKFPIPDLAALQHGHISLRQLRPHLPPEQFESFFKFAFVRNPFDRFVSYCSFMTRFKGEFLANPQQVMAYFLQNPPRQHVLFWPQNMFIADENGELLTDYVGRVEEMQQSYDEVARRIGVPTTQLEKVNTSTRSDFRTYYTPPLVDGVARLYARDLELFGYEF